MRAPVEPKPLRDVVVGALRDVLVLVDVLVLGDERLVSGTEVEDVVDVPVREKIGRGHTLLFELLLVRVQVDRLLEPVDDDHERWGGHGSRSRAPGNAGAAAGLPCGMQSGGGLVKA